MVRPIARGRTIRVFLPEIEPANLHRTRDSMTLDDLITTAHKRDVDAHAVIR